MIVWELNIKNQKFNLEEISDKMKRKCNVCGQVHLNCPFTDCYSEEKDGEVPDDIIQAYEDRFGK